MGLLQHLFIFIVPVSLVFALSAEEQGTGIGIEKENRPLLEPSPSLQFHDLFTTYLSHNIPIKMDQGGHLPIPHSTSTSSFPFYQRLIEEDFQKKKKSEGKLAMMLKDKDNNNNNNNINNKGVLSGEERRDMMDKVKKAIQKCMNNRNQGEDRSRSLSIEVTCPEVLEYLMVPSAVVNDYVTRRQNGDQPFKGSPFFIEASSDQQGDGEDQRIYSCPHNMRMAVQWWMTPDDIEMNFSSDSGQQQTIGSGSSHTPSFLDFEIYSFDNDYIMELNNIELYEKMITEANLEEADQALLLEMQEEYQKVKKFISQPKAATLPTIALRSSVLSPKEKQELEQNLYLAKYHSKLNSNQKPTEVILLSPNQWIAPQKREAIKENIIIYCYIDASNLSGVQSTLLQDQSTPEAVRNWLYNFGSNSHLHSSSFTSSKTQTQTDTTTMPTGRSSSSPILSLSSELYMDRIPESMLYKDFLSWPHNQIDSTDALKELGTHDVTTTTTATTTTTTASTNINEGTEIEADTNAGRSTPIQQEKVMKNGRPKRSERIKGIGNPTNIASKTTSSSLSSSSSSGTAAGGGAGFQMWQAMQRWSKQILLLTIPPPTTPILFPELDPVTGRTKLGVVFTSSFTPITNDDALAGHEIEVIGNKQITTPKRYFMSFDDFNSSLRRYMKRYGSPSSSSSSSSFPGKRKEFFTDPIIEKNRQKLVSLTSLASIAKNSNNRDDKKSWGILEIPSMELESDTTYEVRVRSFYKYASTSHQSLSPSFMTSLSSSSGTEVNLLESNPNAFSVGPFSTMSDSIRTPPLQIPDAPSLHFIENPYGTVSMNEITLKVKFPLNTGGLAIEKIVIWKKINTEGRNKFVASNRNQHSASTRYSEWQPAAVVYNPLETKEAKNRRGKAEKSEMNSNLKTWQKDEIEVQIQNLLPATLYEFKATIANEKGISDESNRLVSTSIRETKSHFKGGHNKLTKEERPYVMTASTYEFFQDSNSLFEGDKDKDKENKSNREKQDIGGKVKKGFINTPQFEISGLDASYYKNHDSKRVSPSTENPKSTKSLVIRLDDIHQKVDYSYTIGTPVESWSSIDVWSAQWSPYLYRVTAQAMTLPPSNDDWYYDLDYIQAPSSSTSSFSSSEEAKEKEKEEKFDDLETTLAHYHGKEDRDWILSLMKNKPNYENSTLYPLFLDKIVLIKRGNIPLVEKVLRAQRNGAIGVIIVDDDNRVDNGIEGMEGDRGCHIAFDQYCVQGSNKIEGDGFAAQDFQKPWNDVVIPAVLMRKDDFITMIKDGNY